MTDEITLDAPETRIERFLAAAAGVEGITLDEPETRIEKYLYKIAQGSGGVPPVEDADKGKYLHANESNGALEWAEGGSGGGPLVVHAIPSDDSTTLDKTWQDIKDADAVSIIFDNAEENARNFYFCSSVFERAPFDGGDTQYVVKIHDLGDAQIMDFIASSESGYPSYTYE